MILDEEDHPGFKKTWDILATLIDVQHRGKKIKNFNAFLKLLANVCVVL